MDKRNYYDVLGVNKSASTDEIKRAYRKKAVELHPDKSTGDAEKFKEVNEAYQVLKDEGKRKQYDQFGHSAAGAGGAGYNPFGGGGSGFGGFEGVDLDLDLGDIFSSFFGGAQGGGHRRREPKGRDVEAQTTIDFKDAVFGTTAKLSLNLDDICSHCKGKRGEPGAKVTSCKTCGGSGRIVETQGTILGNIQHSRTCNECGGRGEVPDKLCSQCKGRGTVKSTQQINVKIPAGIRDGAVIRLPGKGEATAGGTKGDLYLHISVRKHKDFVRQGHDIYSEKTISLPEAVLGSEIKVDTVDGQVKMKVPAGTQSGQDFKLSGHGVPYGSRRGAHVVSVKVDIPKKLTKRQRELLEEFAKDSGQKPFWKR